MIRFGPLTPALVALGWFSSFLGAPALAADSTSPDTVTVPTLAAPPSMQGTIDVSWDPAAKLTLGQDFTYRRPAA